MHQNMSGDIEIIEFDTTINYPDARLTVDTAKDFDLIKNLITDYHCHLKKTEEIIDILIDNRELMQINNDVQQKKWSE